MNNNEITIAIISAVAALLGSFIGAAATIFSVWFSKKINQSGKLTVFIKATISRSQINNGPGFYEGDSNMETVLEIPLLVDVCNTSGEPKIVRNINLVAFNNKVEVAELHQVQWITVNNEKIVMGDNESYTFVVPEKSARRLDMEFVLSSKDLSGYKTFDEIVLRYYDEKNRLNAYHFFHLENCWKSGRLDIDNKFILR